MYRNTHGYLDVASVGVAFDSAHRRHKFIVNLDCFPYENSCGIGEQITGCGKRTKVNVGDFNALINIKLERRGGQALVGF